MPVSPRHFRVFRLAAWLDALKAVLPPAIYIWGTVVLCSKLFALWAAVPAAIRHMGWGMTLIFSGVAAYRLARPAVHAPGYARAWLDWRNQAGGRLMADDGEADSPSPSSSPSPWAVEPALSYKPLALSLAWPLFFLAICLWIPERTIAGSSRGRPLAGRLDRLGKAIESVEENRALPGDLTAAFRERMRDIGQTADQRPEAAAWAIDAIRRQLDDAVLSRVGSGLQSLEAAAAVLERLPTLAQDPSAALDALRGLSGALAAMPWLEAGADGMPEALRQAMRDLWERAGASDWAGLADGLDISNLDPAQWRRLMEALRECVLADGQAAQACLLSPEASQALAAMLRGAPSLSGQNPGSFLAMLSGGGISQSMPDDSTVLTLGRETSAEEARFRPVQLPPGSAFVPGARLETLRRAIPDDLPPEEFRAVSRTGAEAEGPVRAGAASAPLSPARAEAAARYFRLIAP